MVKDKTETHTLSLYKSEWQILKRISEETGIKTISGALRFVIRQWESMRAQEREVENVAAAN